MRGRFRKKRKLKIRPEGGEKADRPLAKTKESFLKKEKR